MDWLRRPSGLLVPPEPRIHRARYCDLFGGSMMGALLPPETIRSRATTMQTLVIPVACIMQAKEWGAGGGLFNPFDTSISGAGGGYATGSFPLFPGDVVSYASGGRGNSTDGMIVGTSGSGTRNGGTGSASGGGATELYINGVPVLVAGGGGAGAESSGGGGGGQFGGAGADREGSTGGGGGRDDTVGAGGISGGTGDPSKDGSPGSGGTGGNAGDGNPGAPPGGGGGGGRYGGGGGAGAGFTAKRTGGGGGSGYDSTGAGTLIAATDWHAANSADPDRPTGAGDAEQDGAVVLTFTAT